MKMCSTMQCEGGRCALPWCVASATRRAQYVVHHVVLVLGTHRTPTLSGYQRETLLLTNCTLFPLLRSRSPDPYPILQTNPLSILCLSSVNPLSTFSIPGTPQSRIRGTPSGVNTCSCGNGAILVTPPALTCEGSERQHRGEHRGGQRRRGRGLRREWGQRVVSSLFQWRKEEAMCSRPLPRARCGQLRMC